MVLAGLLTAALLTLVAAPARGAPETVAVVAADLSDYPEVTVTVAARLPPTLDGATLPPQALRLSEAGAAREVAVSPAPTEDLEVVLLLDTSVSSDDGTLSAVVGAAVEFVLGLPDARVAVVSSGGQPRVVAPASEDHAEVTAGLGTVVAAADGDLLGAVPLAVDQFSEGGTGRRILVAVSTGSDTASATAPAGAAAAVSRAGAALYALDVRPAGGEAGALAQLAAAAIGDLLIVEDAGELVGVLDVVTDDLANSYELSYRSEEAGPTPVAVTLDQGEVKAESTVTLPLPSDAADGETMTSPTEANADPAPSGPPEALAARDGIADSPTTGRLPLLLITGVALGLFVIGATVLRRSAPSGGGRAGRSAPGHARQSAGRPPAPPRSTVPRSARPTPSRAPPVPGAAPAARPAPTVPGTAPAARPRPDAETSAVSAAPPVAATPAARAASAAPAAPPAPAESAAPPAGAAPAALSVETASAGAPAGQDRPAAPFDDRMVRRPPRTSATAEVESRLRDQAAVMAEALVGEVVVSAWSPGLLTARHVGSLVGQTVTAVEGRGTHLLIWSGPSGLALHTRMGPVGTWVLSPRPAERPKTQRSLRAVLDAGDWRAECFAATTCEVLTSRQVALHPVLHALKPRLQRAATAPGQRAASTASGQDAPRRRL